MRRMANHVWAWGLIGALLVMGTLCAISTVAAQTLPSSQQQVALGQSSSFSGTGFTGNESISFWMTGPDKSVTALPGGQADGRGVVSLSVSFSTNGFWQVTAHGINSGHEVVEGFNVGDPAALTATAAAGGVAISGTPGNASLPAGTTTIAVNQATTFVHGGFQANEMISFWTTGPDGKVTALDGASADGGGNVTVAVSFATSGYWQLTAHGISSGREVISGYAVGDLSTAPTAAIPIGTPVATPNPSGIIPTLPVPPAGATATSVSFPDPSSQLTTSTAATVQAALGGQPGNLPSTAVSTYTIGPAATPTP